MYPPPYERTRWYYVKAVTECIRGAIDWLSENIDWLSENIDWLRAISNVNIDEKILYFTKTLFNIINYLIRHETIAFEDKDSPWINN